METINSCLSRWKFTDLFFFSVQFSFLSRHVAFYGRFAGNLWQYVYRYDRRWTARLSGPAFCQRHQVEKDEHTRTDRMHFDLLLFLYKQLPLIKRCTCILFRFRKHRLGSDLFRKLFFFCTGRHDWSGRFVVDDISARFIWIDWCRGQDRTDTGSLHRR